NVGFTVGHDEVLNDGRLLGLHSLIDRSNRALVGVGVPLSTTNLSTLSVLIVGHARKALAAEEIEAICKYVSEGGGLLLVSQGWSWQGSHKEQAVEDSPMTKLGRPFQVRWSANYLDDPTDQTNGSPIFHTFYPQAYAALVPKAY